MCKRLAKAFTAAALAVLLGTSLGVVLRSQDITIPNTFTNDTVADAPQVNANFASVSANALNRAAGVFSGTATPATDNALDLGSASFRFANIYAGQFRGGGANLTGLAAANITAGGVLPALDGSALTNVWVSGEIKLFEASCPAGSTDLAGTYGGRYIVIVPSGGTLSGTIGTALTDLENRPVGQHAHTLTMNAHSHTITDPGHVHTFNQTGWTTAGTAGSSEAGNFANASTNTGSATTGISVNSTTATGTIANSGSVAGTNAPAVQLRACKKT